MILANPFRQAALLAAPALVGALLLATGRSTAGWALILGPPALGLCLMGFAWIASRFGPEAPGD